MKEPFSPWLPYGVMIAACIALAAYVVVERQAGVRLPGKLWMATTPGVVRSLSEEPADGKPKTHAVVRLFDGSDVEGDVAPGCLVFIGDRVVVTDVPGARLVFPEAPR